MGMSQFELDSYTGDAVPDAPVSNEIPFVTGDLQGKFAISRRRERVSITAGVGRHLAFNEADLQSLSYGNVGRLYPALCAGAIAHRFTERLSLSGRSIFALLLPRLRIETLHGLD